MTAAPSDVRHTASRGAGPAGPVGATRSGLDGARRAVGLLALALVVSVPAAVAVGQADVSVPAAVAAVAGALGVPLPAALTFEVTDVQANIVVHLRLPRVLAAAVVGAGLALAGAVLQTLTRNPLADPFLLGLSSGASLGAVTVVVLGVGAGALALPAGAFVGAVGAFGLVIVLGTRGRRLSTLRVILAGVAVAQLAAALMSLVIIWSAMPQATQRLQFWLAGSLAQARWVPLVVAAVVLAVAAVVSLAHARVLDAFAFGEDAAATLGVEVTRVRLILLVTTSALTGALVALSGVIGFVGLVLPHAVRLLTGPRHRLVLPTAALAGAIFLIWVDAVARTAFAPRELPVGVITALVGVPCFVALLRRVRIGG